MFDQSIIRQFKINTNNVVGQALNSNPNSSAIDATKIQSFLNFEYKEFEPIDIESSKAVVENYTDI